MKFAKLWVGVIGFGLWAATAQNPPASGLSREQQQGRELAEEMRSLQPVANATNQATLEIRDARGNRRRVPMVIETQAGTTAAAGWSTRYLAKPPAPAAPEILTIVHSPERSPTYILEGGGRTAVEVLVPGRTSVPFMGSDFWLDDLGLEFLHWPEQKIIPGPRNNPPMVKGRSCKILESRNPAGKPYSRVVSWVDNEFKSLIQADAYDASGKLLKQFSVGSFEKVDGVWMLKDMDMIDEQRETKTRLEFQLKVAQ